MQKKFLFVFSIVAVCSAILYAGPAQFSTKFSELFLNDLSAQDKPAADAYEEIGKEKGVWNDGQAALWDLNIIDHYRLTGSDERARGYHPEQPIKFSHKTHLQKNQMDCQFCHWNVAKSPYAAIPEVNTCTGCHQFQASSNPDGTKNIIATMNPGTTPEQKAEISKIHQFAANNEPIPWEKVHVMPDYVRFNHKRHIKGGVTCQECHGQIPEMESAERVSSMKMGWCVSCHRERGTSIDCYVCHK